MSDQLVLVTGASGYIACHVVKLLQETGYRVRGTFVRSLKNSSRVDPLKKLVSNPKHPLELTEADLESDDGWDKAMEGVYAVMHTASPFPPVGESPSEQSLVKPAVEGTKRVLSAAAKAGIKKVVVTSSFAAVSADPAPADPSKKFDEEDWTDTSNPAVTSYSKSKTLAERAAWDLLESLPEDQRFELSTVNPVLVMGPPLVESNKSATSVIILRDAIMAKVPGSPKLCFPICDVRDVALAHLKCLTNPEAVGKRHIISSGGIWMKDMNQILADEFKPQNYKVCTRELPNFAIWLASIFNESVRKEVYPRLGSLFEINNSRMKNVLGIEPTSQKDSILDMAYAMIELGIVAKTSAYKGPKFSEKQSSGSAGSADVMAVTDL
ncbi:LOW QUALITY PROTEIN: NADPH-dependent aldehyde reductase ARI1-like [Hyalella azteca]|uniref:LOW QUALITY PROTEIN: NADPH-dependent aldehyde reductase ARI1-like n=1 Tax=Hyalella azteca TaxID=294128 RepID=A0A8B7NPC6_HYAAZ|nr:LOW QUALITY PROTEIN: NADPH-dependent aldehyde reductase ARI1-like [Hyalella azteca]